MYNLIGRNLFWFLVVPYIIFVIYVAVIYFLEKDKNITISECVGKTKLRSLIFALFIELGSIPVYLTLLFWLGPSRGMSGWYSASVIGMFVGQTWFLLFSHNEKGSFLHNVGSRFFAGMAILSNTLILSSGQTTLFEKIFLAQFIISSIIITVILFFNKLGRFTFFAETFVLINWAATFMVLAF